MILQGIPWYFVARLPRKKILAVTFSLALLAFLGCPFLVHLGHEESHLMLIFLLKSYKYDHIWLC